MDFRIDPALVLYLPCYGLDGASLKSTDKYGHLCAVTGALWTPRGRSFDGTDDFIDAGTSPALNITQDLTLTAWAYRTADPSSHRTILSKGTASSGMGYCLQHLSTGVVRFVHSGGGAGTYLDTDDTLGTESWHHLAVTVRDGTSATISINGRYSKSGTLTALPGNTDFLCIGARDTGSTQNWGGLIGEIAIYNRALTPLEIRNHYVVTKWRYE